MDKSFVSKYTAKALDEISLLRDEYDQIIMHTKKAQFKFRGQTFTFIGTANEQIKELYEGRKDRKYAGLTIELCSLVEQLLKDIFTESRSEQYRKENHKKNVIHDLEDKLEEIVSIKKKGELQNLLRLRNHIIHEEFSLKKARKALEITEKNKELFPTLLKNTESYVNSISAKRDTGR